MKTSTQRILTTHVGSLPRPPDLLALILAKEQGAPFDAEVYASRVKSAIADRINSSNPPPSGDGSGTRSS
jgi:5-methyltetrahydropteroyltriglutamate--homocysteine methyltransferase